MKGSATAGTAISGPAALAGRVPGAAARRRAGSEGSGQGGSRPVLPDSGRDYADVRPLSGSYSGPAAADLAVTVKVTRLG